MIFCCLTYCQSGVELYKTHIKNKNILIQNQLNSSASFSQNIRFQISRYNLIVARNRWNAPLSHSRTLVWLRQETAWLGLRATSPHFLFYSRKNNNGHQMSPPDMKHKYVK